MAHPQPVPASATTPGGKSPEAFRTISEVASELDLPQHVLRFWETRFAVIRPLKRNGGRRYYRPEDVALLRQIRDLLRDKGYTIKGVQKLLRQGGARSMTAPEEGAVGLSLADPLPEAPLAQATLSPDPAARAAMALETRAELEFVLAELISLRALVRG